MCRITLKAAWSIIASLSIACVSYADTIDRQLLDNKVTFYTEMYPPANYIADGKLVGVTVDTLKAMWREMGIQEQEISMVPWSRGYRFALTNDNVALFTMSRTTAREELFKWVGPVFYSTHVLIAKKSKQYQFNNLGEIFSHRIAAVRGDISEVSLLQVGFPEFNMSKVSNLVQAHKMLTADRVDMMVVTIHGFKYLSQTFGVNEDDYQIVWQVNKVGNYIAFSLGTSDSIVQQYQQAFDAIATQRRQIKINYSLPEAEY